MAKSGKPPFKHPQTALEYLKWYGVYGRRFVVRSFLRRNIPDQDLLFFRIHKDWFKNGEIKPGAFQDRGEHPCLRGMSVDWERYCTAETSLRRARNPRVNGIVSLQTGSVRELPGIDVDHDPYVLNRAHSHVNGEKDTEIRLKLARLCRWVVQIPG
jgi:hypothetical protein